MPLIDIENLIDSSPLSRFQWQVIAICLSIGLLDGMDIQLIGVAAPALSHDWGLQPKDLGPVFMAAPAGMIVGALGLGPLADRFGRRWLIIVATFLFGVFTFATARATSLQELIPLRFLTGLGLGGVLPNLIALVNEYSPTRLRGTITAIAFCGLPLGSMFGALLAHWAIPLYGWPSLFYVGGLIPMVIAVAAVAMLPESIRYLTLNAANDQAVLRLLRKIAPQGSLPAGPVHAQTAAAAAKSSPLDLFGRHRTATTLLLILSGAMNMFMLYFFLNWLPTLMHVAGMTQSEALLSSVLINLGGTFGAFSWGVLMDRYGNFRTMSFAGVTAAAAIVLVGFGHDSKSILIPALFVSGFCVLGAQIGAYSLVASVYPTRIRSTGVGAVLGVGRLGSVIGPMAGGVMLALGWPIPLIFAAVAIPGLISALCIWTAGRLPREFS